jgi:hypothetical protein
MAVQDLTALGYQLLRHCQAETRHKVSVDLALMHQRVDDGPHLAQEATLRFLQQAIR